MARSEPLEQIYTKISGTMSGDDAETRQTALATLAEIEEKQRPKWLDLVPQWDNPYDGDAIQIFIDHPTLGRVQLGFVKNSDTVCDFCQHEMERFPQKGKDGVSRCPRCKHSDQMRRDGAATRLSQEMRRDPSARFYGAISDITGGKDGKSFGCNIVIRRSGKRAS
jgi:hypothetical protein